MKITVSKSSIEAGLAPAARLGFQLCIRLAIFSNSLWHLLDISFRAKSPLFPL